MSNAIGDVIYSLRMKAGLKPEELASRAKVSFSTVYKTETGMSEPSARILKKLAKALGVEASFILKQTEGKK